MDQLLNALIVWFWEGFYTHFWTSFSLQTTTWRHICTVARHPPRSSTFSVPAAPPVMYSKRSIFHLPIHRVSHRLYRTSRRLNLKGIFHGLVHEWIACDCRLIDWLVIYSSIQFPCQLIGWLFAWLIDWLLDCFFLMLFRPFPVASPPTGVQTSDAMELQLDYWLVDGASEEKEKDKERERKKSDVGRPKDLSSTKTSTKAAFRSIYVVRPGHTGNVFSLTYATKEKKIQSKKSRLFVSRFNKTHFYAVFSSHFPKASNILMIPQFISFFFMLQ